MKSRPALRPGAVRPEEPQSGALARRAVGDVERHRPVRREQGVAAARPHAPQLSSLALGGEGHLPALVGEHQAVSRLDAVQAARVVAGEPQRLPGVHEGGRPTVRAQGEPGVQRYRDPVLSVGEGLWN